MTPELSGQLAKAVNQAGVDRSIEERRTLARLCDYAETWDDLPPWWREKIEAWEAPH